jgi:hypothetical protein
MNSKQQLLYFLIVLLAILNTFYLYFGSGLPAFSLTQEYAMTIAYGMGTFLFFFISLLLYSLSFTATRVLHKKNLLRVNALALVFFFIVSLTRRIFEVVGGTFCATCWLQTGLVLLLLIMTIFTLRSLYHLARELFPNSSPSLF